MPESPRPPVAELLARQRDVPLDRIDRRAAESVWAVLESDRKRATQTVVDLARFGSSI